MNHEKSIAILIGGYAGAGKDTMADYMVENYGFTKFSIEANVMREIGRRNKLAPGTHLKKDNEYEFMDLLPHNIGGKLQYFSHKMTAREMVAAYYDYTATHSRINWAHLVSSRINMIMPAPYKVVISDWHLIEEYATFVSELNANVITTKVLRPGLPRCRVNSNVFRIEHALDYTKGDIEITNGGELEDFYTAIDAFMLSIHMPASPASTTVPIKKSLLEQTVPN